MPVTDVHHDLDTRTLTITADFAAPVQRVWDVYADPRRLERVWGPPTHPATFVDHDLVPGGRMTYYMTSPEGEKYYAYWTVTDVDEPRRFTFDDGFALDEHVHPRHLHAGRAQRLRLHRRPARAPGPPSWRRTTAPRPCRRCSPWASWRARRLAINQIDDLLAA